jgi:hypothetical protein
MSQSPMVVVMVMTMVGEEAMMIHIVDYNLYVLTLGVAKATDDGMSYVHGVQLLYDLMRQR